MHPPSLFMPFHHHLATILFFLKLSSLPVSFSGSYYHRYENCAPVVYGCGKIKFNLSYPFHVDGRHDYCGHPNYYLNCSHNNTTLMISINNKGYLVKDVDTLNHLLTVVEQSLISQSCPEPYENTTIDPSLFDYCDRDQNVTLYVNCTALSLIPTLYDIGCALGVAGQRRSYYRLDNTSFVDVLGECSSTVLVPMSRTAAERLGNGNLSFGDALKEGFILKWAAGRGWCGDCARSGGRCGYNFSSPADHTCYCPNGPALGSCLSGNSGSKKQTKTIIIGVSAGAGVVLIAGVLCVLWFRYKKRKQHSPSSKDLIRNSSFEASSKDPELGSIHYQTHVFTYEELQEATNHFDSSKELGDGGFGTVYKGKLRDGRVVAVKRLYENNFKRVEQFMNEIAILSGLRHQNLVSLYGCTSRRSRELLLVYEFVPNGTVADHLHGPRASERSLTWPMRLSIAIETADALAYLHAVEPPIIHRDVKTNNILLDGSFHVKVADFGLSRLFPTDATHVSTAPQGTPGYLDPEYHQCYQLTDRSDVYSFGVVLVELISSKPAVDITRRRHEINLASMAINKIQNCQLDELVDPDLGYQSDWATKKMITMVVELAFRCLQSDGEMRPPIREVLEVLTEIESEGRKTEKEGATDARDDAGLLKNIAPFSPDSVTAKWVSKSTTPNTSE
ncbi:LEAF RUST 10 DISEASE-RESISTANCE LOCUS RECEPTOR-LIKE PROTEIN KINASE-like 1.2 isoform X6 [Phoenix dactylifera]|uniref:non-specific serine/threonine protein kinase n=1 Tax=Phoenix dactylifera TaxID=42345 RepID=A0A8B7MVV4_PHODC|nr:LEAF RUST 10 DISEASE-RESISTANCE LOCUS RECEPTOR-LIKE PROTEIN KINASE-like 1.2 isoform X6 [Phoenix dactylifera]